MTLRANFVPTLRGTIRPAFGAGLDVFRGLLNEFPGAAAAYSLRALSSAWVAGDVVEVRREDGGSDTFTASQITNGLMLSFVNHNTTSLYNASMYFDGVDDYVDTSLASGEVFTGFTAAMKSSALTTGRSVSTRGGSGQGFILRYNVTGTKYEAVVSSSTGTQVLSSGAVAGSSVMDVVATWDGTTARLYVGGSEVDSAALAGTMATSASLKIGASEVTANFFHTGVIYDVRIFDSALSPSAVGTLYDSPADGSEFAAYAGDGNNNSNWVDTSGNGYNGTVFGTPAAYTGQGFDGFVSIWYDQSGNANNATQATTTAQPKIVSAGALVVGGIDFDGVDDQMMVVGNPVITAVAAGTYSTFSVHTVATAEAGYLFGNPSAGAGTAQYTNTSDRYTTTGGTSTALDVITGSSSELLLSGVYNNGDAGLLINGAGTMTDQGTYTFAAGTVDFTIGNRSGGGAGATFLAGQIQEIIVYNSNQSANRVAIETNINAAYTIF